jgi:hypothetical protein
VTDEIKAWLGHLRSFQRIWVEIAPGFVDGDLKKFGHQKFSDLLPANILSAEQIANRMEAIGALCQRDGIGIPTQSSLQDVRQTCISFINRTSSVSILAALVRLFRNIGIEADPILARFGESSVAGMTVDEVLGESSFEENRSKRTLHEMVVRNFEEAGYSIGSADLESRLDSTMSVIEISKSIVD